jgi:2-polyprenyl-6-methoxyphenol hydroxylase-like FAD-dependent oxidoreductase
MTRVAIVGAGQTGASLALSLAQKGVDVSLYSDRSQASLRNETPPTGSAVIFGEAQQAERRLGLKTYADVAPLVSGMSNRIVAEPNVELIAFDATFDGFTAQGVDPRLKADDRITAFLSIGGTFVVAKVDVDALDEIASNHDLTLVATGKGGLASLFARDEARSSFSRPQRSLLLLNVTGLGHDSSVFAHRSAAGAAHAAFSFIGDKGEAWWGAYYHKDVGPSWSFLGWAKAGTEWEQRFAGATNAATALEVVTDLHRDFLPWDLPEVLQVEVIPEDPHSWLKGAVTPSVRSGIGWTKSGRPVASLGDTSIAFDPLAGQGAQGGLVQAAIYADRIVDHEGVFDEVWIRDAFETYFAERGSTAEFVTRLFLGHPDSDAIAQLFIGAANGSERFAAQLFGLISTPKPLSNIRSPDDAKRLIEKFSGEDADVVLARSEDRIKRAQDANQRGVPFFKRSQYAGAV